MKHTKIREGLELSVTYETSYSGSIIEFDIPTLASKSDYRKLFIKELEKAGFSNITQAPNNISANVITASKNDKKYGFYFQGADKTAWWGFQGSIVDKMIKNSLGSIYLVASVEVYENGKYYREYYFLKLDDNVNKDNKLFRNNDNGSDNSKIGRLIISQTPPNKPQGKWEKLEIGRKE